MSELQETILSLRVPMSIKSKFVEQMLTGEIL